ncbi:Hypothetical predicted protein [Pelobates cultripes]|uniref:Uncharacterized protein n=1 Tax=Pelobates cultripes TaxID=61616 RepID=A0AAD1SEB4_PELCU|nr:Hypothetical predicted protein [Pelobates cultripes]
MYYHQRKENEDHRPYISKERIAQVDTHQNQPISKETQRKRRTTSRDSYSEEGNSQYNLSHHHSQVPYFEQFFRRLFSPQMGMAREERPKSVSSQKKKNKKRTRR